MKPPRTVQGFATRTTDAGTVMLLDTRNPEAVVNYERTLYRSFLPVIGKNPLIRDLWSWDDRDGRLRTQVPYDCQVVTLLTGTSPFDILFSNGTNIRVDRYWQSAAYNFPRPPNPETCCELLIMSGVDGKKANPYTIIRDYVRNFLLAGLAAAGYRYAYATTADHLRRVYKWQGAEFTAEQVIGGYRRTLLRWDLLAIE